MPKKNKPNPGQDLYDIFVAQGIKLAATVGPKLVGKASPELIGSALFDIVKKIETEGEKNGVKFDPAVILHGSKEILSHLINISQVDINEEQVKAVVGVAVGKYLNDAVKTGKMTEQEVAQLAQAAQAGQGAGPEQGISPPTPTDQPTPGIAAPQGGGMPNV